MTQALIERYGLDTLYIADLDGIEKGTEVNTRLIQRIRELGMAVWLDPGVRERESACRACASGVDVLIVGLETLASEVELARILQDHGAGRIAFSLDLRQGRPLARPGSNWSHASSIEIAQQVIEIGIKRLIVLDLDRIGRGEGTGTEELIGEIRKLDPTLEIYAGGGIRTADELGLLAMKGASGVLVGRAVWEGAFDALRRAVSGGSETFQR